MLTFILGSGAALFVSALGYKALPPNVKGFISRSTVGQLKRIGHAGDSRRYKLEMAKDYNREKKKKVAELHGHLSICKRRFEKAQQNVERYTQNAKDAKSRGDMEAAANALTQVTIAEKEMVIYQNQASDIESAIAHADAQLQEENHKIRIAESNQALYDIKAESIKMREKMLEMQDSFGGEGNFDFDAENEQLEAEMARLDYLESGSKGASLLSTEPSNPVNDADIAKRLEAL